MNAKTRALDEAAKSSDLALRKWAEDQKAKAAACNPPELPQMSPGEAPASKAGHSSIHKEDYDRGHPSAVVDPVGKLGNCADCNAPSARTGDRSTGQPTPSSMPASAAPTSAGMQPAAAKMKLYHLTCQNPACRKPFEAKSRARLYCGSPCATEVNRGVMRHVKTNSKRRDTCGVKRGKRIYQFSGL